MIWAAPRLYRNRVCLLASLGAGVAALGVFLAFYGFPQIVRHQITKRIVLGETSESFGLWKDSSFPLLFKVYLFNVTNAEEVSRGARPALQEVGPYVYRQYRHKSNITFDGKSKLTYYQKKVFKFDTEKSKNFTESDQVILLNTAMLGMILTVNKVFKSMLSKLNDALPILFGYPLDPFIRCSVGDVLFKGTLINCSSEDSMVGMICMAMASRLPPTMRAHEDPEEGFIFSMFHHQNNTLQGPYTIDSGAESISRLGQVLTFEDLAELPAWDGACSILNGTDATIFPPVEDTNFGQKSISVFQADICRSMYASYVKRGSVEGLPAARYEVGRSVLQSATANPDNECFCPDDWSVTRAGCALDGVLGLERCQRAPVVASLPHFYLGSPSLADYVASGLQPDKLKHQTFVDIEPKTGAVLRGAKRMQFNMELAQIEEITILANVTTGLFPLIWVEEGGELPPSVKTVLDSVYRRVKMMKVLQWVMVATGVVLALWACGLRGAAGRVEHGKAPLGPSPGPPAAPKDGRSLDLVNRAFGVEEIIVSHH